MAERKLVVPSATAFNDFIRTQAAALRAKDQPPSTRREWESRRAKLREAMFAAMGPFPEQPAPPEAQVLGVLHRPGYRIERLIFQSRPDVWVTANAYVPDPVRGKLPAVLAVHGHWPWARRDPVVQARCLGLVKLGFFVLAVDAFGAGERYTEPAKGTYHGALYGGTLWPVGQTLLGMQVYDNRRAVDYLRTRPEVDGDRLGITGASGGGNQTMYAGALDERFKAVVPVCSVGNYQAYLKAACCVCEVLPGALRFTEEGDVLGLVAPRALLVINATKDAVQFSVPEAEKSVGRARAIYRALGVQDRLRHVPFESPHAYNQPMREAMYGWMTRWLKDEGKGEPIAEPAHGTEKVEDLACFPDPKTRPKSFLFPPSFASREAKSLIAKITERVADHAEEWESRAFYIRSQLQAQVLGEPPRPAKPAAQMAKAETADGFRTMSLVLHPEPGMPLPVFLRSKIKIATANPRPCLLLHLDGKKEALKHPLALALLDAGYLVAAPDLRATGETKPAKDGTRTASDHHSSQHALWIGRPLLGQWLVDIAHILDWLAIQANLDPRFVSVAGIGPAGIVALCAAATLEGRIQATAIVGTPATLVTDHEYGPKMRMALLAPGFLKFADVPHLAATLAPRPLVIADSLDAKERRLPTAKLQDAFGFTRKMYGLYKAERKLTIAQDARVEDIVAALR